MNEFTKRTITGSVYVIMIVLAVITGRHSFFTIYMLLMIWACYEFYSLTVTSPFLKITGILSGILLYTFSHLFTFGFRSLWILILLIPIFVSVFLYFLFTNKHKQLLKEIAFIFFSLVYIVLPFSLIHYLGVKGYDHYHWEIILGFMILLWINDTFAYITGSLTGKHLLFPEISPKKTWEGTIGGILMTIIVSIVLSYVMDTLNTSHWIFIGIITAITGTLGDLTESKIKRNLDVKNSGTFLPGHGGILDRTDSMLIALPCVFIYLYMIQNII